MGRGTVRVKYNHLPAVIKMLPKEIGRGLDEFVDHLDNELKSRVWRRYGIVTSTIQDRDPAALHANISVGLRSDRGFYSRFNEWGTVKQSARPVVGPVAHESEPKFAQIMEKHIKRACDAQ
jgi:HK97 gp10 family phage protein